MAAAKKTAKKATAKKAATKKSAKKATTKKSAAKKGARKATKKAAKKAGAGGASAQLLVGSKVKERIRQQDARMSGEFLDAVNAEVDALVSRAVTRAKDNNRTTVRPQDL